MMRSLSVGLMVLTIAGCTQSRSAEPDSYELLLHSPSLAEQRAALTTILRDSKEYVPRIQQSLRDYPKTVRTDWTAANRAVHVAALVRDSSFAPILAGILADSAVLDECIYACPVVFALTIQAVFAGWTPPPTLDTTLTTVSDLKSHIPSVSHTSLEIRPLDSLVQGPAPAVERHRKSIEGKSEEELIKMAGPTSYDEPGWLAALALQGSVTTSKNRIELYLLLMNESKADASSEYRRSIYEAIYRAETARARGR